MKPELAMAVQTTEEPCSVDAACQQVQAAIVDGRENGGTVAQVRTAALKLIKAMFDDLDATVR